jgi:NTP pyrophosphatase (non-canonical NTP hydrolase)
MEIVTDADLMNDVKKALFYGQLDLERRLKYAIIAGKYGWEPKDGLLSRPNAKDNQIPVPIQRTLHAIIGILTEAGELAEAVIKAFGNVQNGDATIEDAFDHINLREEYGDLLWYTQLGLNTIGSSIPECMTINDRKLEKRYGPAFSRDRATNRDLDAERGELK